MKIGIAFPNTVPGASGALQTRWAVRAEERGFSSVAATHRLCYPGHEPLAVLAAAAGATSRIGLSTNILVAPLTTAAVLAKEAATVASLAGDRVTLGLGPGVRADDFRAAGRDFAGRAAVFDAQLAELARLRAKGGTGELPGAVPPVLVGGVSRAAVRRAVRWADGWTAPGLEPERVAPWAEEVRAAWDSAGRAGRPRLVALSRYWLGEDVAEEAAAFVRQYFQVLGAEADSFVAKTPSTPEGIRDQVGRLAAAGFDEVIFHPTAARLAQVDRLADVLIP
ncbi:MULTISPECIES: LLM class flavin-dependent oxidoreductase [Streptomyces]|jgi:alkanesulfonate monooxygenase SsuD/methylene tetrahydromethanopterin reductase-like flavin-dependent oxidoreductase (luciferase family)|uniref:Alkanesulfonate monooxygenase SsuD/methylene tetrahydromethanopterin reductase-like flavin-dependent oxidoreductase (Luciferase family) n=2 Tax=Streptomyces TaxID=1883 RepID=A0ABT9L9L9_STRGD|nr:MULTISPECIES: LLM class flavin-dependent oxidoreductase [Streptomyces]MDP9680398.1 alkanesulfonate monooxygenase SsuD/methylene tetrahydromethanopterin reductase-like flavin-dependent oxidoreductase (luciferase family) [Streptomyces griseoviridis]GGT16324.1 monooxygenase [Streptomyces griseoviridis]GGU63092.1 monooxygenase [Streptomyces daghestanicus]GHI29078.1 monooxygenase [Streptomyces daghestanicus]